MPAKKGGGSAKGGKKKTVAFMEARKESTERRTRAALEKLALARSGSVSGSKTGITSTGEAGESDSRNSIPFPAVPLLLSSESAKYNVQACISDFCILRKITLTPKCSGGVRKRSRSRSSSVKGRATRSNANGKVMVNFSEKNYEKLVDLLKGANLDDKVKIKVN